MRRGIPLAIVDNLDPFYPPQEKRQNLGEVCGAGDFTFFETDICEVERMQKIVEEFRPTILVHLAAKAGVRPSIELPLLYERVNVGATYGLLEISRKAGVKKFVFGSSSSVYGATSHTPFSEGQTELRPISPYAATKMAGEMICYTYAHLYKMPCVCLRFFTVYGPRQRPDLAIRKFTSLLFADRAIPFFGDGTSGRDYTNVRDIVAGVLAAMDYDLSRAKGAPFEVFNLGNSHPVTLTHLLETLERITGKKAIRDEKPMQPGDVPITWADISKASKLLGYAPCVPLEKGLEEFVGWYRKRQAGK